MDAFLPSLISMGALVQEVDPGAQAVKRGMEQERVRKNVRPAEDPPFQVDLDRGTVRIRRAPNVNFGQPQRQPQPQPTSGPAHEKPGS